MNAFRSSLTLLTVVIAAGSSHAQFVKGNEALTIVGGKVSHIETPPLPKSATAAAKSCAALAGCHPGPWYMVKTAEGLRECTEPFARPSTCRTSTYGSQKLSRLWMVKSGSRWLWCTYPDISKKCIDMNARPPLNLPVSTVQ